jgi:hypothetical protein
MRSLFLLAIFNSLSQLRRGRPLRIARMSIMIAMSVAACASMGCTVYQQQPRPVVAVDDPAPQGPVIEGPGVEVIQVEPVPVERVYVYDPGFPPGTYFYSGYYWYGGYRYEHDVFIHRYVDVNVREHRYIDVSENRRAGQRVEQRQVTQFARQHPGYSSRARSAGPVSHAGTSSGHSVAGVTPQHQPNTAMKPAQHQVAPGKGAHPQGAHPQSDPKKKGNHD